MTAASLKRIVEEALAEVGATVNFKLVPKGKARTTTWLGVEHGFGIRHYPSGRNVYIVQTRMAGRMRTVTIGPASILTRYQAQMVARRVIAYAQVGRDPPTERQRIRSAPSFPDFVTEYWDRWAPRWKASTLETHTGYRRRYLDDAFAGVYIDELNEGHVTSWFADLNNRTGPGASNRTFEILKHMLNKAEEWGYRLENTNPCRSVRPNRKRQCERFLTNEELARLGESADCLLMLGVIVCDTNFGVSGREIDMRASIRALDRTVVFAHHIYPDVTLEVLIDALTEIAKPIGAARSASGASYVVGLPDDATPLAPSHIAIGINDLFETHGPMPMAADVGDCLFIGLEVTDTELVAPGYYASMGTGVPAGLAINAVAGRRPIVLVGDGAFQMTGWELGNCQRYGWSPIVIVLNNQGWGMLRSFAAADAYTDLADFHYADLAQSLGGKGERVETCSELAEALKRAVEVEGSFYLIEAMLPRGSTSDALQRFTQAIKRISALANE